MHLERLGAAEPERRGLLARLRADHPPTPERVARLREHAALAAPA